MQAIVVPLGIGFPVALILGWVYEISTDGVKRTESVSADESVSLFLARKIDFEFQLPEQILINNKVD